MQNGECIDKQQDRLKHGRHAEDHGGGRREDGSRGVAATAACLNVGTQANTANRAWWS